MASSLEEIEPVLARILAGCGIEGGRTLADCIDSYARPTSAVFSVPTNALSKVLRSLKARAPIAKRSDLEQAFMKLVTKDNGCLVDVLKHILLALDDQESIKVLLTPNSTTSSIPRQAATVPGGQIAATQSTQFPSTVKSSVIADISNVSVVGGMSHSSVRLLGAAPVRIPVQPPAVPTLYASGGTGALNESFASMRTSTIPTYEPAQALYAAAAPASGVRADDVPALGVSLAVTSSANDAMGEQGGPTVLDALLAYAESTDVPLDDSADAIPSRSSALPDPRDGPVDPLLLRYGCTVQIRSASTGMGGFLAAHPPQLSAAAAGRAAAVEAAQCASTAGGGTGSAAEVFIVVHAIHGQRADGLPVRMGDSICLRNMSTSRFLGTAAGARLSTPFPPSSTSEACHVRLGQPAVAPIPSECWMVVAPDALLTAVRSLESGVRSGSVSPARSLPRPFVTLSQRLLLLPHASSIVQPRTHEQESVGAGGGKAGARAAVMRLHCLQAGSVAQGTGQPSAAAAVFSDSVTNTSAGVAAGRSTGAATPISPAALALALAVSPPPSTLWSFFLVHPRARAGIPLPTAPVPEWALCRPLLTGLHILPAAVWPPSYAALGGVEIASAQSTGVVQLSQSGISGIALKPSAARQLAVTDAAIVRRFAGRPAGGIGTGVVTVSDVEVLEHLLDALLGSPGTLLSAHVSSDPSSPSSSWDEGCSGPLLGAWLQDVSFRVNDERTVARYGMRCETQTASLVQRMLPLATCYVRCSWWVEKRSRHGQSLTGQACAGAVRGLLREYTQLVVQLEKLLHHPTAGSPPLSLAQAWYFLQPSLRTLAALDGILYDHKALVSHGGALINILLDFHAGSGDDTVRTITAFLAEKASAPLLSHLCCWLYTGRVNDLLGDFFVIESIADSSEEAGQGEESREVTPPAAVVTSSNSLRGSSQRWDWATRFRLTSPETIPAFLRPHAQAILTAGKYMCALNECRTAAQEQALGNAAKRVGIAAAMASIGAALSAPCEGLAVASDGAFYSPTKLPRMPSALLGADGAVQALSRRGSAAGSLAPSAGPGTMPMSPTGSGMPPATGSVLDSVFESRRASVAPIVSTGTTSANTNAGALIPAAGLPSNSMPGSIRVGGQAASPSSPYTQRDKRGASLSVTSPSSAEVVGRAGHGQEQSGPGTKDSAFSIDVGPARFVSPAAGPIPFGLNPESYEAVVGRAYAFSARALLRFFLYVHSQDSAQVPNGARALATLRSGTTPHMPHLDPLLKAAGGGADLLGRLSTLKTFFLCSSGDWLGAFLEGADGELAKDAAPAPASAAPSQPKPADATGSARGLVSLSRVRMRLEAAFRGSVSADDPYLDSVRPALATCSLMGQIDALVHAGMLQGEDGGRPARTSAKRCVDRCWASQQGCKELDLRATLSASHLLRHRMLNFLAAISYYFTVEVLEPRWATLGDALGGSGTLDDVVASHDGFLNACLAECLLTSPDLLKILTKLVTLCLLFADQIATAIERHRLSEEELDSQAGLNRAGVRAREQMENGEYYAVEEGVQGGDAAGAGGPRAGTGSRRASKGSVGTLGAGSTPAPLPAPSTLPVLSASAAERDRRKARLTVQANAMRHALAQAGWQQLIAKSGRMFDALLRDFMLALEDRTRADRGSHLVHLCARLDLNGFYAPQPGPIQEGGSV